jgi:chemotaxis signal transduction protein
MSASELRADFDRAFTRPLSDERESPLNYIACRVGTESLAVSLSELSGLQRRGKIVPLRSPARGLLGVAGVRSRLMPVYRTSTLLGLSGGGQPEKWIAICGTDEPIGLALDELEGYLQASAADRSPRAHNDGSGAHLRELLSASGKVRPILHVSSLLEAIRAGAHR